MSKRTANAVTAMEIKKAIPAALNAYATLSCFVTNIKMVVTKMDAVETVI